MTLALAIAVLFLGGLLAWPAERYGGRWPSRVALAALVIDVALIAAAAQQPASGPWLAEAQWAWIPRFGIGVHLALDGLSLVLILLALLLGILSVAVSRREIGNRVGFFHLNLLWALAGVVGIFLSMDLFLFFLFWELMLVPMYLLVALWGHEARYRAAMKFFLFTQGSSLLMLAAILALALLHREQAGAWSFDYAALQQTVLGGPAAFWIPAGFFVAFAVKLPALPFHAWLPDTHSQAPTAGSMLLAGVLLKTGAYGLIRFVAQFFPGTAQALVPLALALALAGIFYGALLAFAQTDLKRLVAYSSISHMGFVLLGIFGGGTLALHGAVMQMIAHGLITPGLFIIAGALQLRLHSRDMAAMGGLWAVVPRFGAATLFFAMAALGLPGLAGFVGEFLVLAGTFAAHPAAASIAALGMVVSVIYALQLVQRTLHGAPRHGLRLADLSPGEAAVLAVLALLVAGLGLYPAPLFDHLPATLTAGMVP